MSSFDAYTIHCSDSCKTAMKKIDTNELKILFIVENRNVLLATLTDGDIRRYLISGGSLEDSVIKAGNKNPKVASSIDEAKKLFDDKSYIAIPIVKNGILVDLFFGNGEKRVFKTIDNVDIVINAGGKGTRLEPFTKVLPKPLIPVGDMPIIEHIMHEFFHYDLYSFFVIVNYKKELMKAYFNDGDRKTNISWIDEGKPLGTGGGLSLLRGSLNRTFFFTNCDILITSDYESILRYHKEQKNVVTMVCAYKNLQIPYGIVEMGVDGTIDSMKEKPEISFLTNTGMYIVEPEVFDYLIDDEQIGFPDVVQRIQSDGKKVGVYPVSENEWMDMGQIDELEKMRVKLYGK